MYFSNYISNLCHELLEFFPRHWINFILFKYNNANPRIRISCSNKGKITTKTTTKETRQNKLLNANNNKSQVNLNKI